MRYQPEFGQFLALSLAIHRRDEVACAQFIRMIAGQVTLEFEEAEISSGRNTTRVRQEERLKSVMSKHMKQLDGLIDEDGRKWLKSFLPD